MTKTTDPTQCLVILQMNLNVRYANPRVHAVFTSLYPVAAIVGAVACAYAYGKEMTKLVLDCVNMPTFHRHLWCLFHNSQSVRKIQFKRIVFEHGIAGFQGHFQRPARCSGTL
jgi:hypothetical protein